MAISNIATWGDTMMQKDCILIIIINLLTKLCTTVGFG